ncbi:MAG: sigma-70 family RNA polymerase sigma factor [Clostridia bacterium]|nr:sigma-70 family RNA polymerase sigma factor [Clostridia bacterium]
MTEQQFDQKIRMQEEKLYRLARSMLRRDMDCADAIQNAVFLAWSKRHHLKDEQKFEAWLFRILINECRNIQRDYLKRKQVLPLDQGMQLAADSPSRDLDLAQALEKLPEKHRLPIVLHYMNGLTVPQIASVLRLPLTTIKGRIREGMKKLRCMLEEDEA